MAKPARIASLLVLASVAACSFAPPYARPTTAVPPAFKEGGPWRVAAPADTEPRGDWWTLFGDPVLTELEMRVVSANPTLASALSRYDQAQAYLAIAAAGAGPRAEIDTSFTRNRQSDHRPLRSANQPTFYAANTISGLFSYELDLWGRVRNAVAAGRASVAASNFDTATLTLSLQTQLATQYLRLRGYDQELKLLDDTVAAYAQADALNRRRFEGGIASGLDASRSGAQLKEAEAEREDVRASRALIEHAIASLTGTPASSFTLALTATAFPIPATPVGVPSLLLERRPDIAAAERRVAAANAEIGVARAAFFPAITLAGSGGFQNTGGPLLTAGNTLWSVGPGAVLALLDGGRRRAQLAIAREARDLAADDYRGTVLQAFQQVEDDLALSAHLSDEAVAQDEAVRQAGITERLSLNRYVEGASTYLDVVTAQTTALRTRRAAIVLRTRRLQTSVQLITATGGGWTPSVTARAPIPPAAAGG